MKGIIKNNITEIPGFHSSSHSQDTALSVILAETLQIPVFYLSSRLHRIVKKHNPFI